MPIPLRPLEKIVEKWGKRSTAAASDFRVGVETPLEDWQKKSVGAKEAWRTGVTEAAGRDAYGVAVGKTPTTFWQKRTIELGVPRYPDGVGKSVDVYKDKFAPFYKTLSELTLPDRGPRGDPRNLERVKTITEALRNVKIKAK